MKKIRDRLNELINDLGLSKNEFAREIKSTGAMISKITTKDVNFGIDVFKKIIDRYPSLNHQWLMSGEGDMWLENQVQKSSVVPSLNQNKVDINPVLKKIQKEVDERWEKHAELMQNTQPVGLHYMMKVHELIKKDNIEAYSLKESVDIIVAFKDLITELENEYFYNINVALFHYPKGQFDLKEYQNMVIKEIEALAPFKKPLNDLKTALLQFYKEMERIGVDKIDFEDYKVHY